MKRQLAVAVGLWAAAFLASCGNDNTPPACTPGESAQCFCADGTGAQVCQSDGTYGECECGANNGTPNNGTPNNGTPNNGTPNNGTPNNGTPNNGTSNNGTTPGNNGTTTTNNQTTPANNGTTNNGTTGPQFCVQTCNVAGDCAVFGDAANWECNAGVCEQKPCVDDPWCVRHMSNWAPGCNSSAQCDFGFICAQIDGTNYCAFEPIAGFFECDQLQLDEMQAIRVDNGMPATICGAPTAKCEASSGFCYRECMTDADCRPAGQQNGLVCNPTTNQCECTENAHCTISGDVCYDGECGCSSQAVCDRITAMSMVPFVCR